MRIGVNPGPTADFLTFWHPFEKLEQAAEWLS